MTIINIYTAQSVLPIPADELSHVQMLPDVDLWRGLTTVHQPVLNLSHSLSSLPLSSYPPLPSILP